MPKKDDQKFMQLARKLALKGLGRTSPNPIVGCIIVKKGMIIARGYHKNAGLAHAEIEAINQAKRKKQSLSNATLYVTLEPCSHFGKTPPCIDAIIKSEIKRVVVGMLDPNPANNGNGVRLLRKSGIKVDVGIMKKELQEVNRPFVKFMTKKLPYVTIKVASSLDGKIATRTGNSKWITNKESRFFSNQLRGICDAVLVGVNTVVKDNPRLTYRSNTNLQQPLKVILDSKLRTPINSRVFLSPSLLVTTLKGNNKVEKFLKTNNVDIMFCKKKAGAVDLKDFLKKLAKKNIMHVLVEGGGETIASFFKEKLVDEVYFFIANKIIGGRTAPTSVDGLGIEKVKDAISLSEVDIKRFKSDILIHGIITKN